MQAGTTALTPVPDHNAAIGVVVLVVGVLLAVLGYVLLAKGDSKAWRVIAGLFTIAAGVAVLTLPWAWLLP